MSQPFIGEIRIFAGNFAPVNWHLCDGSTLNITEYETLYTLLGTTYGGDGRATFGLPDFRSRVPIGMGPLTNGPVFTQGALAGSETVTLTAAMLPAHSHTVYADGNAGNAFSPAGAVPGSPPGANKFHYVTKQTSASTMASAAIAPGGGSSAPLSILQPVLALTFIIALNGIYPSPQ